MLKETFFVSREDNRYICTLSLQDTDNPGHCEIEILPAITVQDFRLGLQIVADKLHAARWPREAQMELARLYRRDQDAKAAQAKAYTPPCPTEPQLPDSTKLQASVREIETLLSQRNI